MFVFMILRNLGLNRPLLKSIVTSYYVLCVGRYNLFSYQLKYTFKLKDWGWVNS